MTEADSRAEFEDWYFRQLEEFAGEPLHIDRKTALLTHYGVPAMWSAWQAAMACKGDYRGENNASE